MYTPAGGPAQIFNFTIKLVIIIFFTKGMRCFCAQAQKQVTKAKYTWRSLVEDFPLGCYNIFLMGYTTFVFKSFYMNMSC